jgi:hypothetical protein
MKGSFNAVIKGINEPMQQALEETLSRRRLSAGLAPNV